MLLRLLSLTLAAGLGHWPLTVAASPTPSTPLSLNGQLHVCGRQLCNTHNTPIQLRGMSTHGLQWYSQCVTSSSLNLLAHDWKADVVRISMYVQEGGYETDPEGFTALVNSYVEEATARGMYAIVDWHMLYPGDPNFNLAQAKVFFKEVAGRHRNKTNVMYEIANEPSEVHWDAIKSYADDIIPVIRAESPHAVVLVGTEDWSSLGASGDGQGVRRILANPVNASNVMYTFHFYAASHGGWYVDTLKDAVGKLPMFVTEFGTQEYTGDGPDDFVRAKEYIDLLAEKKVSWTNWNFSDDFRSGAVFVEGTCGAGAFGDEASLKPAGRWIREQIRARR